MKTYKFFCVALMVCIFLVSCGSNYESLVEDFNMACEEGNKDKVVELKKEIDLENAQNQIYEKKINALIKKAQEKELYTKVNVDEVDQYVKKSMGEIYEDDVVAYEKLVEKTIELLNEAKEGSTSSLKKYVESEEEMLDLAFELTEISIYLQEPLAKRIQIALDKYDEANRAVEKSIMKELEKLN